MKLTTATIEVLKNFSTINQSIQFIPGNVQRTTSPQQNVIAEVHTQEEFPLECAIFDLSKFLGILTLFDEPELEFGDNVVIIKSAKDSNLSHYFYAHPRTIVCPSRNELRAEKVIDSFEVKGESLSKLNKSAAIISAPDMVIESDGKIRTITVSNSKIKSSNSFSIKDKASTKSTYSIVLRNDNLKLIPNTYRVDICENKGVKFVMLKTNTLTYVIPGEI